MLNRYPLIKLMKEEWILPLLYSSKYEISLVPELTNSLAFIPDIQLSNTSEII